MQGGIVLGFCGGADGTRLVDLGQRAPLRVLLPSDPATGLTTAVLVTTSGGLVGGDRLTIDVRLDAGAEAVVTSQAAEKVYRSAGADCRIDVSLAVAAGGWLEWLPQETILFDNSRLVRTTTVHLAPSARLVAGEMLVFGRRAMGETLASGLLRDTWRIYRDHRLVWHDALALEGDIARQIQAPAGFGNAAAVATLLCAGDAAPQFLGLTRELLSAFPAVRAAATCVNGNLVIRALASDARALRDWLMHTWSRLRAALAQLPATMPRVWLT